MKQNKGIASLSLIVLIVLGVAVVGGGAYYLGKSDSKKEVNNPVANTDENLPSEKNKVLENVTTDNEVNDLVKAVTLDMSSELARTYKTAFTNALKQPVSFNGHYVVTSWGCGSGCLSYGIVDKLTGKVYQAPGDDYGNTAGYSGDEYFDKTRWSIDSNLFKAIGYTSIDTYKFENGKFTKIKSDPFTINSATKDISTANWKTYSSAEYGFSFKYPSNWETPSGVFNGKSFELYSKESITVPFITYYPSNSESIYNSFISGPWGHSIKDIPVNINISGQNASKFTYETSVNGKGQPYPLFNQQIGFKDGKGGFFVINFAVPSTQKENGIYLFGQILSSFNIK